MAISAADRWRRSPALRALGLATAAACANPPAPAAPPGPASAEPVVQVGLVVGGNGAVIGGAAPLRVLQPDGTTLADIRAGETWRATALPAGVGLAPGAGAPATVAEQLLVAPLDSGVPVRVNGRSYHGTLALLRDRTGLTVVNRVPMEAYLLGVVSAEMGRRDPSEREALRAQAVISRTYALRNLGRWRTEGFDLYATVSDQVYGGIDAETPEGRDGVESTRGQIVTWNGEPIDAFFFSTCGGRTEDGGEVFRGAVRPYLRSMSDATPSGGVYCSISPRYRWREEWSGEGLRGVLRRSLPAVLALEASRVDEVRDVRVGGRTGSGRVGMLTLVLGAEQLDVDGPQVRQVLRTPAGEILRSTAFTLEARRSGRRIARLVAEGSGNGHGVGLCQWGAVGRARAGQDYQQILAAYYGGTELSRMY
ncbi:MAG TPA: SpoIID/LytB domain-containing protein [Gemmatimonadales bacterium]|nr:SpoIID/LytB domain-containing protein [Gemmatimonadales bacterium]